MDSKSNFTIAKQKNGSAFYASLSIVVESIISTDNGLLEVKHLPIPQPNLTLEKAGILDINPARIKANQQNIEKGFRKLIKYSKDPIHIRITVLSLDWNPVDSTAEALTYAAFYALKEALKINIPDNKLPFIDDVNWKIIFPDEIE